MKRLVPVVLFLAACGNSNLADSFRLETFRVLALVADHPEVSPGDTVTITPFVSDINGGGRSITYSVEACLDPGVGVGAMPTCDGSPTRTVLVSDAAVVGLVAPNYTGFLTSTISVTVPSMDVVFATASAQTQFNGANYLVRVDYKFPTGEIVRSYRQIAVSTRPTKNQNPVFVAPEIRSDGSTMTPNLQPGFKESYDEMDGLGTTVTKNEKILTSWYISDGDLSLSVTDDDNPTVFTPPATPPTGRNVIVVIVTRDNRGGTSAYALTL